MAWTTKVSFAIFRILPLWTDLFLRRAIGPLALTVALLCISCADEPVKKREPDWSEARKQMVEGLRAYGIKDAGVLQAMASVRRHVYVPAAMRGRCAPYGDHPCPIGHGQTISQPYIVAYMTERMGLKPGERILEIGTGSGYQAAILAEMGMQVFSIEIVPELARHAAAVLKDEGYKDVKVRTGDGYKGWPVHSPFDAVIVTCAPADAPQTLVDQLKDNGRMIVPVGESSQRLVILRKKEGRVVTERDLPVRFVPMVHGDD